MGSIASYLQYEETNNEFSLRLIRLTESLIAYAEKSIVQEEYQLIEKYYEVLENIETLKLSEQLYNQYLALYFLGGNISSVEVTKLIKDLKKIIKRILKEIAVKEQKLSKMLLNHAQLKKFREGQVA